MEALRDVSLQLRKSDFVALLGPSGCGKSTLLRLIAGLDQPDAADLAWDDGPPAPGDIGYVFQDATLLPWASAEDNVFLPLRLRGSSRSAGMPEARAALRPSGPGWVRGVAAAPVVRWHADAGLHRAGAGHPAATAADGRAVRGADEFTRHGLQADLLEVWRQAGCTVVFVTHSIYEAAFLARRIVLMTPRPGRIAREIASCLPSGPATRLDPAYAELVAAISRGMEAALA